MNTRRLFAVLALVFGLVPLAGCAANKATPPGTTTSDYKACPRPDWVDNINCEGGFCAVGIGKSMDYSLARDKAVVNARSELASQLEIEARRLVKRLQEENTNYFDGGASSGMDFTKQVTEQLTATTLSGSRPTKFYNDCVQGTVYSLVMLDVDMLHQQLKSAAMNAAAQTHALNRELTDEAVDAMNKLIDQRRDEAFARQAGE